MKRAILLAALLFCITGIFFLSSEQVLPQISPIKFNLRKSIDPIKEDSRLGSISVSTQKNPHLHQLGTNSSDLNDSELIQLAVASIQKNSKTMEQSWKIFRVKMYENAGLTEADFKELDALTTFHEKALSDIQETLSKTDLDSADYQHLLNAHQAAMNNMDNDIKNFLGNERFEYVKKSREIFNKAFREHIKSFAEYVGW